MNLINKGDLLLEMNAYVATRSVSTDDYSLTCAFCFCFLGDWQSQADLLLSKNLKRSQRKWRDQLIGCQKAIPCSNENCFELFCSEECKVQSISDGHLFECGGCSIGIETSNTYKVSSVSSKSFYDHSIRTNHVFLSVRRVISKLISHHIDWSNTNSIVIINKTSEELEKTIQSFFATFPLPNKHNNINSDLINPGNVDFCRECEIKNTNDEFKNLSIQNDANLNEDIKEDLDSDIVNESWVLLYSSLINCGVDTTIFDYFLSFSFYKKVLRILRFHLHRIRLSDSPLFTFLFKKLCKGSSNKTKDSLQNNENQLLDRLMNYLFPMDNEIKEWENELILSKLAALTGSFSGKKEKWKDSGGIVEKGSVVCHILLPYCAVNFNHSCNPTLHLYPSVSNSNTKMVGSGEEEDVFIHPMVLNEIKRPSLMGFHPVKIRVEATRDFFYSTDNLNDGKEKSTFDGEKLTLSCLLNEGENRIARNFQLNLLLKCFSCENSKFCNCKCIRCLWEQIKDSGKFGKISDFALLSLVDFYMRESNYTEAQDICRVLIARLDPKEDSGVSLGSPEKQILGRVYHALGGCFLESEGAWSASNLIWTEGYQFSSTYPPLAQSIKSLFRFPTITLKYKSQPEYIETKTINSDSLHFTEFNVSNYKISCTIQSQEIKDNKVCKTDPTETEIDNLSFSFNQYQSPSSSDKSENIFMTVGTPIFSLAECNRVIRLTEEQVKKGQGWTTSRHYAVPTTDVAIADCPKLLSWFNQILSEILAPLFRVQFKDEFPVEEDVVFFVHDAFIVKYESLNEESSQRLLPLHCDQSSHSFVLALNSQYEEDSKSEEGFSGGGTYFTDIDKTLSPGAGHILSFKGGSVFHGGAPVKSGIRYILAGFLFINTTNDVLNQQQSIGDIRAILADNRDIKRKRKLDTDTTSISQLFSQYKKNSSCTEVRANMSNGESSFSFSFL